MFTPQIHRHSSNYTDSRQILKEIELFGPHGLMFEWNFQKSWSKQSKRKVHVLNLENILFTSVKRTCTNSPSLELFTEKLFYVCHEPVECMNVEFARYAVMFSHAFSNFVDVRLSRAVRNPAERS